MTVKELIEVLKTCDKKSEVKVEHWNSTISPMTAREANDKGYRIGNHSFEEEVNSINANGLYVILKAGSNRAGFIKFDD